MKRIFRTIPTTLVLVFSLLVLVYVGYAEGFRTYPHFMLENLHAQGQTLKNSIAPHLNSGLLLDQFPGFLPLSTPIMASDASIKEISIVNTKGKVLFINRRQGGARQRGEPAGGSFIQRMAPGPVALRSATGGFSMGGRSRMPIA